MQEVYSTPPGKTRLAARRDSVPRYGQTEPIEALRVFAIIWPD